MKKIMTFVLGLAVAALVVIGAGFFLKGKLIPQTESGRQTTGLVMKAAREYWPGHYWVEIAHKKGWFKEAGLNVELVDINGNFIPSVQDFVDGKMDVNHPVLFDLIKYNAKGANLVAVIAADTSFGADAIVAKKMINRVQELRGRRVGVDRGSFSEFILAVAVKRAGLILGDLALVHVRAEDVDPFIAGTVDATVSWEPYATTAIEKGNGQIIFDSAQIPGLVYDVISFHKSFIKERPGDVQAFVNVWHKTTEFIKTNPDEAFGIIAEIYDVTPGEVQTFAQQDKILDLRDNLTAFTFSTEFDSLHGAARRINNFMIEQGITDKQMDSTEFLDPAFIRAVEK